MGINSFDLAEDVLIQVSRVQRQAWEESLELSERKFPARSNDNEKVREYHVVANTY